MQTQVQVEEVASGIWRLSLPIPYPLKHVHTYLLRGDGVALVDTGLKAGALEAALAELGLGFGDLEAVFITHHHPDHYALAGRLEAHGAQVLMLEEEIRRGHAFWTDFEAWREPGHRAFIEHGVPETFIEGFAREMDETRKRVFPPQNPQGLKDGQTLDLAGMRFWVLATPGHAEGQAALLRQDGVLIAGDAILDRVSPIIARWAYSNPDPLADFLATLNRLAELEVSLTLSGHFNPPDLKARTKALRLHHAQRLQATIEALKAGPMTAWEASLVLFPGELPPTQRRFAWAETLAHLEHLRHQGEVVRLAGRPARYALAGG